ncbi:Virion core protein [Nile crocodilepox virus]|uniref:Virion core protein n=1 Tax=Nile crocodilepox virus (isolate Crocodylus niloticus/Zimbabwe/Ume/2001) TaxID=1289473 RepID=Q070J0_CPRVZ|nr:Virion core protein [Nile crocodilepox virus]ABJ08952.1 Virion core protein [Nile crocodilepox virus]
MELTNIYLSSREANVQLRYAPEDPRDLTADRAVKHFLAVLGRFLRLEESRFDLVLREGADVFYYRMSGGRARPVEDPLPVALVDRRAYARVLDERADTVNFALGPDMEVTASARGSYRVRAFIARAEA